jgi:hypothetical protein
MTTVDDSTIRRFETNSLLSSHDTPRQAVRNNFRSVVGTLIAAFAPMGYEDEEGFHFGTETPPNQEV